MTTGNVAELKKRFAGMNIIGVLPGKPNIRPRGNSEESSVSDELRSSSTIYSNEDAHFKARKSDEISLADTPHIPPRIVPASEKKPPVPLPKPAHIQKQDPPSAAASQRSSDREFTHDPHSDFLDSRNGNKMQNFSSNPIPRDRVDHVNGESSSGSSIVTALKRLPLPPPSSAVLADRNRSPSPDPSSKVSLDEQLPSRCAFNQIDSTLDHYRKRDPRTIVYPTKKPVMPMMTTNEMDILQKLSETR